MEAGNHRGPTAKSNTITLKKTLLTFPDAKEPKLSRTNQAHKPAKTDFLTPLGFESNTHCWRNQTQMPQPNKKPPVSADKNLVVGSE